MTRQELELKAREFDSKLKRHPMSSEELQKVLCDFVEALRQHDVSRRSEQVNCIHKTSKLRIIGRNLTCLDCKTTWGQLT